MRFTIPEILDQTIKRIIIADDHAVVRTGLQLILEETTDMSICGEASNGFELIEKLKSDTYDLVILDISMPGKDTMDLMKEILSAWPLLPIVVFSMNPDEIYAVRMIRNGASAYINKETNPEQIIEILRIVLSGKKYFTQKQSAMLAELVIEPEKKYEFISTPNTFRSRVSDLFDARFRTEKIGNCGKIIHQQAYHWKPPEQHYAQDESGHKL